MLFKKLIAVLLCLLLLFSLSTTAFTVIAVEPDNSEVNNDTNTDTTTNPESPEQNEGEGEGEDQDTIIITIGVITEPGTDKIGVNMRTDATTTSEKIIAVPDKTSVIVNGSKDDVGGSINEATQKAYVWYNISYTYVNTVYTGYIREDFITVTEHTITPPNIEDEEDIEVKPFEEQLKEFPENYHSYLTALHDKYPNWIFTADEISISYQKAIALESVFPNKLVENQYLSWRSMETGAYNWNNNTYAITDGRWYGASREVIAYYMDPRNFLNPDDAYIFMKQSYDASSQSIVGLRKLLEGRFLGKNYVDANDLLYGGDYAYVIMEAAKQSGVNPYILASTIIQEQGSNGSVFSNGTLTYKGVVVYNFFNFGVSGTTDAEKREKGAKYAYEQGWTTRSAAIIGGAKKYADGYVNSNPNNPYYNQDTYFYKNYNILNPQKINHQYAQNVADQVSTASFLRTLYKENYTTHITFRIPVYKDNTLPEKPSIIPVKNSSQNNYYFNAIEVEGLTPSFSRYVYNYALQVEVDTTIYVNVPATAKILNNMTFNISKGDTAIKLTVESATGYTNDYIINVNALNDCVITLITEKLTPPPPPEDDDDDDSPDTIVITLGTITEPGENKLGVNMRSKPSTGTNSNKIYLLTDGSSVTVNGSENDIDGVINPATKKAYVWYNVTYKNGDTTYTGYVREDMIKITTQTVTPPNDGDGDNDTTTDPKPDPDPDNPEIGGGDNPEPPKPTIMKGDINNDGLISVSDQAAIRLHVLNIITLTDNAFLAADINNDGIISVSDQAAIRLHILNLIKLN